MRLRALGSPLLVVAVLFCAALASTPPVDTCASTPSGQTVGLVLEENADWGAPHFYHFCEFLVVASDASLLSELLMIDRQNTLRSLPSQEHDWIMATLPNIPDVRFQRVHMEEHDFAAQLAIARGTDVMLGVHGKGLTHQLAMRPGRFVIEYFPASNSFLFDIVSRRGNPRVHEVLHRSPCSPPTITPPPHCSTLPPP
eukprot:CAMPEP_0119471864 /NCGR_PEP_ID=MMETSP1344-20130328/4159_1 /TAXON_ID=236787 /ORGANISM="Florenciella parvula, Strain CCMP2471" /LENGTH=197 /DNA_ID=CAMNT_0007504713 /DNA_START=8 /DNA_END=598 /DNA_ORIENTATION=-